MVIVELHKVKNKKITKVETYQDTGNQEVYLIHFTVVSVFFCFFVFSACSVTTVCFFVFFYFCSGTPQQLCDILLMSHCVVVHSFSSFLTGFHTSLSRL